MFNLLVSGSGWKPDRDTVIGSRIFEYTDTALEEQFRPNGVLDLEGLAKLPTLFMEESGGVATQQAFVGRILNARMKGSDVSIEYVREPGTSPLLNEDIEGIAAELDIEDFEFHRTHWAVKDADLFRALYKNLQPFKNTPRVFSVADVDEIDPGMISVMMPFDPKFDAVHEAIKGVSAKLKLQCRRADDIWDHPFVIQDVVSLIDRSRVVICDCTGRNANVFYEAGIAHTLGRDVILVTQHEGDIPFDLRHLRYLHYLNNSEGLAKMATALEAKLEGIKG